MRNQEVGEKVTKQANIERAIGSKVQKDLKMEEWEKMKKNGGRKRKRVGEAKMKNAQV